MTPLKCKHRCLVYFEMMSKTGFLGEGEGKEEKKEGP